MSPHTGDTEKQWEWLEAKAYTGIIGGFDPPSHFAEAMADTLPIKAGETKLLDIGCGCGIIGIYGLAKKHAKFVTFNDCLSEAIAVTFANVHWHIQQGNIEESQVAGLKADFANIPPDIVTQHNLITFNPPQLPWNWVNEEYRNKIESLPSQMSFRCGGDDGLDVVRHFLAWYRSLEGTKPPVLITLSSFIGKGLIETTINGFGFKWHIFREKKSVPLRKILTKSADAFSVADRNDRSLEKNDDGKWTKDLLIISLGDL